MKPTKIEKQKEILDWSWSTFRVKLSKDDDYNPRDYENFQGNIPHRCYEYLDKAYAFRNRCVLLPEIKYSLQKAYRELIFPHDHMDAEIEKWLWHAMRAQEHLDELTKRWHEMECSYNDKEECPKHGPGVIKVGPLVEGHSYPKKYECTIDGCPYYTMDPWGG